MPETAALPVNDVHPLLRLWRRAGHHRPRVIYATVMSSLNKVFDVVPELLIGAAVDVVVPPASTTSGGSWCCWPS